MADTKSKGDRSRNMAAIRSNNTGPEVLLRKALWSTGLRFFTSSGWQRLTGHKLAGSPDLVFPRARLVVFVDGCFWHGCPVHYTAPDDNREYWSCKLSRNKRRDEIVNAELQATGWKVVRVWEHELRKGGHQAVVSFIRKLAADYPQERSQYSQGVADEPVQYDPSTAADGTAPRQPDV